MTKKIRIVVTGYEHTYFPNYPRKHKYKIKIHIPKIHSYKITSSMESIDGNE